MKIRKTNPSGSAAACALAVAVSCAIAGFAHAQGVQVADSASAALRGSQNAGAGVEERLREELRVVMSELIETGAFGDKPSQQIALAVDTPAQRVSNLGLLIDSAHASGDGVHVLGVTPGGSAERMGLRGGDVLVALNGASLASGGDAAKVLRQTVDGLPNGSALAFDVQRNGHAQAVSGTLASIYLPPMRLTVGAGTAVASASNDATGAASLAPTPAAAQGCGRISDFDVGPRQQQLHGAKIISIDGALPGPGNTKSYRVDAGTHVLEVSEHIESRYLSFNDRLRNSGNSDNRYKKLTVDVAPNTTILIAARLNNDKLTVWKDAAYWDPVAWKQVDEACR
jgi:membrane-associated protease RseP (regulator of RpoE activity)